MKKSIRAFVAVELPQPVICVAEDIQRRIKIHNLHLRWVKPANIHLTLKFLGEIAVDKLSDAQIAIQQAALGSQAFSLTVQGLGLFPGIRRPRVLWIGLQGALESLHRLQRALEQQFAIRGFARESHSFKAHLTLARMPRGVDSDRLQQAVNEAELFAKLTLEIQEIVLFKSDLQPTGAIYTPLFKAPVGA